MIIQSIDDGLVMIEYQFEYYDELLTEFTAYREQSVAEKEQMKREIQKCKQQLEKIINKIDKRVDAKLNEEKLLFTHRLKEVEEQHNQELERMKQLLSKKDATINDMRNLLRAVEIQKRQLVQNNTRVLVELTQGLEGKKQKIGQAVDQRYRDLAKMYEFLIEQNNQLKKQIYLLKRNATIKNVNDSFLIKEQKSLNTSDYKPKSVLESSKLETTNLNKSTLSKQKGGQMLKEKKKVKSALPPTLKLRKK